MEAVHILGLEKKTKIYQASTSELYGKVEEVPQNEKTPFHPYSPYAVAKQYGYWMMHVTTGDVITMQAGCRHTVQAITELKLIEVQLGKDISVQDKQKFSLE